MYLFISKRSVSAQFQQQEVGSTGMKYTYSSPHWLTSAILGSGVTNTLCYTTLCVMLSYRYTDDVQLVLSYSSWCEYVNVLAYHRQPLDVLLELELASRATPLTARNEGNGHCERMGCRITLYLPSPQLYVQESLLPYTGTSTKQNSFIFLWIRRDFSQKKYSKNTKTAT